jgi:hypothetical protein
VVFRAGEFEDLGIAAGLLLTELIARETEDREALGLIVFVKGTQTCVLRGEASLARNVDYQTDVVFVVRKVDGFAGDRLHLQVVKLSHRSLLSSFGKGLSG